MERFFGGKVDYWLKLGFEGDTPKSKLPKRYREKPKIPRIENENGKDVTPRPLFTKFLKEGDYLVPSAREISNGKELSLHGENSVDMQELSNVEFEDFNEDLGSDEETYDGFDDETVLEFEEFENLYNTMKQVQDKKSIDIASLASSATQSIDISEAKTVREEDDGTPQDWASTLSGILSQKEGDEGKSDVTESEEQQPLEEAKEEEIDSKDAKKEIGLESFLKHFQEMWKDREIQPVTFARDSIVLTETDTFWLCDILYTGVLPDSAECERVEAINEEYENVLQRYREEDIQRHKGIQSYERPQTKDMSIETIPVPLKENDGMIDSYLWYVTFVDDKQLPDEPDVGGPKFNDYAGFLKYLDSDPSSLASCLALLNDTERVLNSNSYKAAVFACTEANIRIEDEDFIEEEEVEEESETDYDYFNDEKEIDSEIENEEEKEGSDDEVDFDAGLEEYEDEDEDDVSDTQVSKESSDSTKKMVTFASSETSDSIIRPESTIHAAERQTVEKMSIVQEPCLKHYMSFTSEEVREKFSVSCISFNSVDPHFFATGYDIPHVRTKKFSRKGPQGCVIFWDIRFYQKHIMAVKTPKVVTCLDFSRANPRLVAAGMCNGFLAIFDIYKNDGKPLVHNYNTIAKPVKDIKRIRWTTRLLKSGEKKEVLLGLALDGRLYQWYPDRATLRASVLKPLRAVPKNEQEEDLELELLAEPTFDGVSMDLKPDDLEECLVGTAAGPILLGNICGKMYAYNFHIGPVNEVRWSQTVENVFATCGNDSTLCFWEIGKLEPCRELYMRKRSPVNHMSLSNVSSTLFAAVAGSQLNVYDVSINRRDELMVLPPPTGNQTYYTWISFFPMGNFFLLGRSDGIVDVYEVANVPVFHDDQEKALKQFFIN